MSLYLQFAPLFDYPDPNLSRRIEECTAELKTVCPRAAGLLETFQHSERKLGITALQEAYTGTFDLQPECTLNLGYHLFGEDQRRGVFLAKLKELYQTAGIVTGSELPDHLCHLLRYVAARPQSEESRAIVGDCLLPAIAKIAQGMKHKADPYRPVLDALLLCLENESASEPVSHGIEVHAGRVSVSRE